MQALEFMLASHVLPQQSFLLIKSLTYSAVESKHFRLQLSESTDHTQNAGMTASNVSLQISVLFKRKVASDIIYLTWLPESRVALGVHRGRSVQENERGLFANHSC